MGVQLIDPVADPTRWRRLVKKDGLLLQYACPDVVNDLEIAFFAVRQNSDAMQYVQSLDIANMIASKFPEAIEKASDLLRQEMSAGKHQVVDSVVTNVVDSIVSSEDEVHDAWASMASSSTVPSLSKQRCSTVPAKISGLSVNGI